MDGLPRPVAGLWCRQEVAAHIHFAVRGAATVFVAGQPGREGDQGLLRELHWDLKALLQSMDGSLCRISSVTMSSPQGVRDRVGCRHIVEGKRH